MKLSKSSAASAYNPGCPSHRMVKGWRSNRGYMFAMMLAMLALMAVMGVGLSRLMMTTKATTQMQRTQDNKQLMSNLVMTLSSKAADGDGDFVLEPPAYSTETITGFAAPTNGGFVGTDVANTDAWGRRLGYCAYDYGSATATPPSGTGLIRGSTASSPTDSWVAVVVISAGPDGVINTPCPAADTAASGVAATGDDMVAARSYGEMVSFGNAQIASSLSGMGTNTTNKLCRLGSDGKMICDIKTGLSGSNTANRLCRTDASGAVVCDAEATTCSAGQLSKWNGSSFECVTVAGSLSSYAQYGGQTCGGVGGTADSGVSVSCPAGYIMTGGGYVMTAYNGGTNSPDSSGPCGDNCWHVRAGGVSGGCFNAYAMCLTSGGSVSPPPPGPSITGSGGICRKDSSGNVVCDIKTGLSGSNTANRLCRINSSGVFTCDIPSVIGDPSNMWRGANCTLGYDGLLKCVECPSGLTATWNPWYGAVICA